MKLGRNTDKDLLAEAMKTLGHTSYTFNQETGDLSVQNSRYGVRVDKAAIAREYSKQVVLSQAAQFGWVPEETEEGKGVIHVRV